MRVRLCVRDTCVRAVVWGPGKVRASVRGPGRCASFQARVATETLDSVQTVPGALAWRKRFALVKDSVREALLSLDATYGRCCIDVLFEFWVVKQTTSGIKINKMAECFLLDVRYMLDGTSHLRIEGAIKFGSYVMRQRLTVVNIYNYEITIAYPF